MKRTTTIRTFLAVLVLGATMACKQNRDAENLEGSEPGTATGPTEMDVTTENSTTVDTTNVDTVGM